jgi:hypothetical protein
VNRQDHLRCGAGRWLGLVAASLLLATAPARAAWVAYAESESGMFYVDPESVREEGNRRQVWRLFDLKERRTDGVQSGKALVEVDCNARTYRYLRTLYYAGPMARGKYLGGATAQPAEPISPGSAIGDLARRVCARGAAPQPQPQPGTR